MPRICYAFVRGSSRIKLTQQNPSPSLPLAQVRALNTRRIEPVPFVNNQSPMKRSTSPSIIKAVLFTYSMFAVTSFLSDEGAGADAVGAAAVNDAARYHLGLQSASGDKREKKSHKIGTKRGAGRPCRQSRGAVLSHESQLKELKCTDRGWEISSRPRPHSRTDGGPWAWRRWRRTWTPPGRGRAG